MLTRLVQGSALVCPPPCQFLPRWPSASFYQFRLRPGNSAREHRSASVEHEFQLTHPSPATGLTSGLCPGWVKDYIVPLACGGLDEISNLQWQTIRDAKAKDKWETKGCAR
jgi:hypothetical protein